MIDYGIKGKVALITGANNPQVIGAATAFAFAQQRAKVVLVYKREPRDYKYGITVNCVAPGPTQTGWIDEDLEKAVIPMIPAGELIQPENIAQTILFLASEQARMITGQVIKVSGGHAL